jgi:hypothetical protein
MRTRRRFGGTVLGVLAILVLLPGGGTAHAGFVAAVDINGGFEVGVGPARTLGYAFTPNQPLTIDALMIYKPTISLASTSIPVTIWNNTTMTAVAPATNVLTTDPTFTTPQGNTYFVHTLSSPIMLAANQEYVIGGLFGNDADVLKVQGTSIVTDPRVTYNGSRSTSSNAFPPGNQFGQSNSYFGPSFEIAAPTVTPEPASITLAALGALGLLGYGWRRRNRAAA